jgi:hypothetical protein
MQPKEVRLTYSCSDCKDIVNCKECQSPNISLQFLAIFFNLGANFHGFVYLQMLPFMVEHSWIQNSIWSYSALFPYMHVAKGGQGHTDKCKEM